MGRTFVILFIAVSLGCACRARTAIFKVLEDVRFLVRGVVPDVLLNGLYLLDQVEFVLLRQAI